MSIALVFRRSVQSMYFMTQSVRTKLIQQQFGQYMDKSFRNMKDIKDVYEWMEGPLVDAVQCDVNGDTQINVHLYTPVHVSLEVGRSFHIIIYLFVY
jgi:hypothetical protein